MDPYFCCYSRCYLLFVVVFVFVANIIAEGVIGLKREHKRITTNTVSLRRRLTNGSIHQLNGKVNGDRKWQEVQNYNFSLTSKLLSSWQKCGFVDHKIIRNCFQCISMRTVLNCVIYISHIELTFVPDFMMIVKVKLQALLGKLFTVLWQLFPDTEHGYSFYFLLISIWFCLIIKQLLTVPSIHNYKLFSIIVSKNINFVEFIFVSLWVIITRVEKL